MKSYREKCLGMEKDFRLILLTHSRELLRKSNTGRVVLKVLPDYSEMIVWNRTQPDSKLCELLALPETALVYPASQLPSGGKTSSESKSIVVDKSTISRLKNFVLIDATWQEARKIYNKSPYLKAANKITLSIEGESRYLLRRNQKTDGFSTVETVSCLCRYKSREQLSDVLEQAFDDFMLHYRNLE